LWLIIVVAPPLEKQKTTETKSVEKLKSYEEIQEI
jgi:hypothetical protein